MILKCRRRILKQVTENNKSRDGVRPQIYFKNGTYKGEWKDNLKHGRGVFRWQTCEYSGEWMYGRRHGHGTFTRLCPNTNQWTKYDGFWRCGRREGYGSQFYPDDESYHGHWLRNRRSGWGRMYYNDGSIYEGNWLSGNRHGSGILRLASGDMYEGMWHEDKRHGFGSHSRADTGHVQQGLWVEGSFKCGTVNDRDRKVAPNPAQYPIPPVAVREPTQLLQTAAASFVYPVPEEFSGL